MFLRTAIIIYTDNAILASSYDGRAALRSGTKIEKHPFQRVAFQREVRISQDLSTVFQHLGGLRDTETYKYNDLHDWRERRLKNERFYYDPLVIYTVLPLEGQSDYHLRSGDLVGHRVGHHFLDHASQRLSFLPPPDRIRVLVTIGGERDEESVSTAVHHLQRQGRSRAEYLPFVHHDHGVTEYVGLVEVMGGQDDGPPYPVLID